MNKNIIIIFIYLFFSHCSSINKENVITYTVKNTSYTEKINASGYIESTKMVSVACPRINDVAIIIYLIPEGSKVKIGDTVCILESDQMEQEYDEALQKLEVAQTDYDRTLASQEMQDLLMNSEARIIESSLKMSMLDSNELIFTTPARQKIIHLELKKSEIEKQRIINKQQYSRKMNASELKKKKMKIIQAENHVARMKGMLDKLVLKSPINGKVIYSDNWWTRQKNKIGDNAASKMPLVKIPDMNNLQVKLELSENLYKRAAIDQDVKIRPDALPGIILNGKVKKKVPLGKKINRESDIKKYEVLTSIENSDTTIVPGLSVHCDIIIDVEKDTIVIPIIAIDNHNDKNMVYVLDKKKYIQKEIEISKKSENKVIVSRGLKIGDVVALNKPSDHLIKNN